MNENLSGSSRSAFLNSILIPKLINGVEKSTAAFRSDVIVKSHMAMSALWNIIALYHIYKLLISKEIVLNTELRLWVNIETFS